MNRIDAHAATRLLIDNAFSHLTWYDSICTRMGFRGISQIWKDDPAWYFWMENVEGAFWLRLLDEENLGENQYVSMAVHYFPGMSESFFRDLSAGEKWLLSDESAFDRKTSTPRFEVYDQFFDICLAAEIGLVVDPENVLQLLIFSTEKPSEHPAFRFLDLLVKTLHFQSGRHHRQLSVLRSGPVSSLLLNYSEAVFRDFLDAFELDAAEMETLDNDQRSCTWAAAAHLDAECSMHGACSCHH